MGEGARAAGNGALPASGLAVRKEEDVFSCCLPCAAVRPVCLAPRQMVPTGVSFAFQLQVRGAMPCAQSSRMLDALCGGRDRGRPIRAAIEAIVDVSAWHPGRVVGLGGGGSQLLELDLPTLQWEVVG